MSYCTIQHITDRKGTRKIAELSGDNTGQAINEPRVQSQIDSFAERMNAALRHEYPKLGFGDEQLQLRDLNVEGAYLLLERDSDRGWTEEMIKQWKMLLDDLDKIADGRMKLQTLDDQSTKKKTDGYFSSNRRLFRRNSLPNMEGLYE
jgi:phage gp36-like protein